MLWMGVKAGVIDLINARVPLEELSNPSGAFTMLPHAQRQCFEGAQDPKGIIGSENAAHRIGEVRHALGKIIEGAVA